MRLTLEPYFEPLIDENTQQSTIKILVRDPKNSNHDGVYKEFFEYVWGHNPKVGMFLRDKN